MPSKWEYLEGLGRDYLLAHAPIGCRDYSTVESLQTRGIPAYFSGCITLTLPKRPIVTPAQLRQDLGRYQKLTRFFPVRVLLRLYRMFRKN